MWQKTYQYDRNGNMVKLININSDGEAETTTYEYDEYGNIIAMVTDTGYRTEYVYEAMEVTEEEAWRFNKRQRPDHVSYAVRDCFYYYLIPNPIW